MRRAWDEDDSAGLGRAAVWVAVGVVVLVVAVGVGVLWLTGPKPPATDPASLRDEERQLREMFEKERRGK
jgi:hypothetical protein